METYGDVLGIQGPPSSVLAQEPNISLHDDPLTLHPSLFRRGALFCRRAWQDRKVARNSLAARSLEDFRQALPPHILHPAGYQRGPGRGAGRDGCSGLVSVALSSVFPGHSDPVGRGLGAAASKAGPAARAASTQPAERQAERAGPDSPGGPHPPRGHHVSPVCAVQASRSSVRPPPAFARLGPRTASADALRRDQHLHGAANHQVHQGSTPLPVPAHGGPDLPSQGSGCRDLPYRPQHDLLPPNTKLPLWATPLRDRGRSPRGLPGTVFRAALPLPRDPETTPAPGARVCAHGRRGPLLSRPGVTRREQIDHLQEVTALTLQSYIEGQQPRPGSRFLYAKLLGLLAELRSINNAFGYQIRHIRGLAAMMPLLQEICS
ncbi:nuclear receptor subfamily 1 group I member 3 isoform X1 [Herpailurus yagouaroundi]|uniref:nuclear receptor subfamily 1 group I member 3 isoform X1 n=1 Tax=Herpailurus yagouaroundi TaxID=1608482 RepID=UPI001AD657C9|nr:nuclear receptor subfamily 1 group I member 3 isoform X1 [Puma yagouaroundi]